MPTLVIDRERLQTNLAHIRGIAHAKLPLRVVAKSLPSPKLLEQALTAWTSKRAMLFNAPMLVDFAKENLAADVLMGKPLPVSAAAWALQQLGKNGFNPARQLQWLVDTPVRLTEYASLARQQQQRMRINVEIDVGLHRGGVESALQMAQILDIIKAEPMLHFSGLMGYDAHLSAIPDLPGLRASAQQVAQSRYAAMLRLCKQRLGVSTDVADWTCNAGGSHTLHLHDDLHAPNELSVGSAVVKPGDFDSPSLSALLPAAFIATPVLKTMDRFRLPQGVEAVSRVVGWWDANQRRAIAIHGGHWLADVVSPPGVLPSGLYGASSNQQVMVSSPSTPIEVGDWLFLRPRQSEAVFLQFGEILVVDQGRLVDSWPVYPASA